MTIPIINGYQSEWLKTKGSAASWLVIIGGCFIPLIMLTATFVNRESIVKTYGSGKFWITYNQQAWQFMAVFLLPVGVILATSLITQLEYKNNTWKQLHTTPQKHAVIFFAKLAVIITMMLQFFIFFNTGIYFSGLIPCLVISDIPFPKEPFPWKHFFEYNAGFFTDCLPIVALQYLISLRFKNFLVSIGSGLALLLGSMFAAQWDHGYIFPYTYCIFNFLDKELFQLKGFGTVNIHFLAAVYFIIFTVSGFILYITKKEKG